jgi:hypothetical protein
MRRNWRGPGFLRILGVSAVSVEMPAICEVRLLQSE